MKRKISRPTQLSLCQLSKGKRLFRYILTLLLLAREMENTMLRNNTGSTVQIPPALEIKISLAMFKHQIYTSMLLYFRRLMVPKVSTRRLSSDSQVWAYNLGGTFSDISRTVGRRTANFSNLGVSEIRNQSFFLLL